MDNDTLKTIELTEAYLTEPQKEWSEEELTKVTKFLLNCCHDAGFRQQLSQYILHSAPDNKVFLHVEYFIYASRHYLQLKENFPKLKASFAKAQDNYTHLPEDEKITLAEYAMLYDFAKLHELFKHFSAETLTINPEFKMIRQQAQECHKIIATCEKWLPEHFQKNNINFFAAENKLLLSSITLADWLMVLQEKFIKVTPLAPTPTPHFQK